MTSRRRFIEGVARGGAGLLLPSHALLAAATHPTDAPADATGIAQARGFLDLRRAPDAVQLQLASDTVALTHGGGGRWTRGDSVVTTMPDGSLLRLALQSPTAAVRRVHLRWRGDLSSVRSIV